MKTALYRTMTMPTIAPTTMLAARANSLDPDLATAGLPAEELLAEVEVAVAAELEADERALEALVDVTLAEVVAVLGYKSELLYVVQELVAGIAGLPLPGSFWLSPLQTENSLGL